MEQRKREQLPELVTSDLVDAFQELWSECNPEGCGPHLSPHSHPHPHSHPRSEYDPDGRGHIHKSVFPSLVARLPFPLGLATVDGEMAGGEAAAISLALLREASVPEHEVASSSLTEAAEAAVAPEPARVAVAAIEAVELLGRLKSIKSIGSHDVDLLSFRQLLNALVRHSYEDLSKVPPPSEGLPSGSTTQREVVGEEAAEGVEAREATELKRSMLAWAASKWPAHAPPGGAPAPSSSGARPAHEGNTPPAGRPLATKFPLLPPRPEPPPPPVPLRAPQLAAQQTAQGTRDGSASNNRPSSRPPTSTSSCPPTNSQRAAGRQGGGGAGGTRGGSQKVHEVVL